MGLHLRAQRLALSAPRRSRLRGRGARLDLRELGLELLRARLAGFDLLAKLRLRREDRVGALDLTLELCDPRLQRPHLSSSGLAGL